MTPALFTRMSRGSCHAFANLCTESCWARSSSATLRWALPVVAAMPLCAPHAGHRARESWSGGAVGGSRQLRPATAESTTATSGKQATTWPFSDWRPLSAATNGSSSSPCRTALRDPTAWPCAVMVKWREALRRRYDGARIRSALPNWNVPRPRQRGPGHGARPREPGGNGDGGGEDSEVPGGVSANLFSYPPRRHLPYSSFVFLWGPSPSRGVPDRYDDQPMWLSSKAGPFGQGRCLPSTPVQRPEPADSAGPRYARLRSACTRSWSEYGVRRTSCLSGAKPRRKM